MDDQSEPTTGDKIKQFVKRNQTALACTTTGIIVFAIARSSAAPELREYAKNLRVELNEESLAHQTAKKFIDRKGLGEEYAAFVKAEMHKNT